MIFNFYLNNLGTIQLVKNYLYIQKIFNLLILLQELSVSFLSIKKDEYQNYKFSKLHFNF